MHLCNEKSFTNFLNLKNSFNIIHINIHLLIKHDFNQLFVS
jgi:hypothetical protein